MSLIYTLKIQSVYFGAVFTCILTSRLLASWPYYLPSVLPSRTAKPKVNASLRHYAPLIHGPLGEILTTLKMEPRQIVWVLPEERHWAYNPRLEYWMKTSGDCLPSVDCLGVWGVRHYVSSGFVSDVGGRDLCLNGSGFESLGVWGVRHYVSSGFVSGVGRRDLCLNGSGFESLGVWGVRYYVSSGFVSDVGRRDLCMNGSGFDSLWEVKHYVSSGFVSDVWGETCVWTAWGLNLEEQMESRNVSSGFVADVGEETYVWMVRGSNLYIFTKSMGGDLNSNNGRIKRSPSIARSSMIVFQNGESFSLMMMKLVLIKLGSSQTC